MYVFFFIVEIHSHSKKPVKLSFLRRKIVCQLGECFEIQSATLLVKKRARGSVGSHKMAPEVTLPALWNCELLLLRHLVLLGS